MPRKDELKSMITALGKAEVREILQIAGRNRNGSLLELQARCMDLLRLRCPAIEMNIQQMYRIVKSNIPSVPVVDLDTSDSSTHSSASYYEEIAPVYRRPKDLVRCVPSTSGVVQKSKPSDFSKLPFYAVNPDVRFKSLPYFDVLTALLRPSSLNPTFVIFGNQESDFQFHLSPKEIQDINGSKTMDRNSGDYGVQVQLRFCLLETTCEQDDCFPPNLRILINDHECDIAGIRSGHRSEPINITNYCRLSPTIANTLKITWIPDFSGNAYALGVFLVRKVNCDVLLFRLRSKGVCTSNRSREIIKNKLKLCDARLKFAQAIDTDDDDEEIATTLRVSLMCPIGKMKIQMPCRSEECTHLQCFDAGMYLKSNEKSNSKWVCPICKKPAPFNSLITDGFFSQILVTAPSRCTMVNLHQDGSFAPVPSLKSGARYTSPQPSKSAAAAIATTELQYMNENRVPVKVQATEPKDEEVSVAKVQRTDFHNHQCGIGKSRPVPKDEDTVVLMQIPKAKPENENMPFSISQLPELQKQDMPLSMSQLSEIQKQNNSVFKKLKMSMSKRVSRDDGLLLKLPPEKEVGCSSSDPDIEAMAAFLKDVGPDVDVIDLTNEDDIQELSAIFKKPHSKFNKKK